MAPAPRLEISQGQSLAMSPKLQQAIRLLSLSGPELDAVIAEALSANPLLEIAPEGEPLPPPAPAAIPAAASGTPRTGRHRRDALLDMAAGAPAHAIDSIAAADSTLHQHLLAQAGEVLDGHELRIAREIIAAIDTSGYLVETIAEIAAQAECTEAEAEAILAHVQRFDPTGVGARSLAECLALQAREADRHDPAMAMLIDNLDLLGRGEIERLQRLCGIDAEDMADMVEELRAYDPRPGLRHCADTARAIVPDVIVRRTPDGTWSAALNEDALPRLLINEGYRARLASEAHDKAALSWLAAHVASANWLVRALDQRAGSLLDVAGAIVRHQQAFFEKGHAALRPLTRRAVAEETGFHESTVSRVVAHKHLACARGLFPLSAFFPSAIGGGEAGETVSSEAVRQRIRALVAAEGAAILSDDALVARLKAEGFMLARRTVAKYRETMGIGSSIQRRRARKLQGIRR